MPMTQNALSAEDVIRALGLVPHPTEGGWYVETYRCPEEVNSTDLPSRYRGNRSFSTAIYYLLTSETVSRLHRLASDEVFHFYLGDPVVMVHLLPDGTSRMIILGHDIAAGQRPQVIVPRGTWQGAHLQEGGKWALLGCTVSPGFDYRDYEEGSRDALVAMYPDQRETIDRLTREDEDRSPRSLP